ncbi:cytosolic carboxypeptidase 2-like [Neocloeon triangulifer]|uniref:cytosolic carboxypeptidase 2-like n=1 Tax=Neocloeon triangulifer TaxID=2078957 RepID=UPI00286F3A8C|nr:cytosolic carboxypeptidase 2-like [Neocloeon triangulifer]
MEPDNEQPVKDLQASLFPVSPKGNYLSELLQTTLKTTHIEGSAEWKAQQKALSRLREPRDLFALKKEPYTQQIPRWPIECQVLEQQVEHIPYSPSIPEPYYVPTGRELQPRPVGEEAGTLIYDYNPTTSVSYFSRAVAGGIKAEPQVEIEDEEDFTLQFESRFESGNLAKAIKVTETYYELYLRTDLYTSRHMQWFYFQIKNTRANVMYRLSIVNLMKQDSLYSNGMRPLMYSTKKAELKRVGWHRTGDNITYFKNDLQEFRTDEEECPCYTLTFTLYFPYDNDTVYIAHCYPYTYSTLQDYLLNLQNHPVKSEYTKLRLLCRSLAGNNVYYLTVTEPSSSEEKKKKPAIVVSARVHPGETPASFMMKGLIDFLTGNSAPAKELRSKFIFKLIPMLNPDGVIVGNNRCSLTGRDLNRQYRTVIRETYPPVWHTKVLLRRLSEDCGIALYCDLHAHSRRHNIFIYGCESRRPGDKPLQEQVFPLMMRKNSPDKFCFESCKFRVQRSKEGTGRVVVWMMGVPNSYTMEASFGGSTLGSRCDTHFSMADFEGMGRCFCETLLDFCDDEPSKERLRAKIVDRLVKEGSSADEPLNINLSDYSSANSDEGDTSSASDEDNEVQGGKLNRLALPDQPRDAWCDGAKGSKSEDSSSPKEESPKKIKGDIVVPGKVLTPRRLSLRMPRATLDLADSDTHLAIEDPPASFTASFRRHRRREWIKRSNSQVTQQLQGIDPKAKMMPPELVVVQAQVYESSFDYGDVHVSAKDTVSESVSLPSITKFQPSSERQRSGSFQQMKSMPAYRAFYESHRVLAQRKAVEEKFTSPPSPTQNLLRPKPKLQKQKTIRKNSKDEGFDSQKPEETEAKSAKRSTKLRAKFKKTSIVSVAVTRTKQIAETVVKIEPQAKGVKPSSSQKVPSPSKRKVKKITRGQSTDF